MACRILPWLLLSAAGLITVSADEFADAVFAAIDTRNDGLREINREVSSYPLAAMMKLGRNCCLQIWENPELAFEEVHAHEVLTTFLEEQGFNVTRSAYNLSTAFVAEFSNGEGRAVSFNAEYDALPGIGHSCGHNLIATASVSAAIGVKEALQNQGVQGRVVYGSKRSHLLSWSLAYVFLVFSVHQRRKAVVGKSNFLKLEHTMVLVAV